MGAARVRHAFCAHDVYLGQLTPAMHAVADWRVKRAKLKAGTNDLQMHNTACNKCDLGAGSKKQKEVWNSWSS